MIGIGRKLSTKQTIVVVEFFTPESGLTKGQISKTVLYLTSVKVGLLTRESYKIITDFSTPEERASKSFKLLLLAPG